MELLYGTHKVVLFKCEWWDVHTTRGVKEDQYGFIMINTTRRLSTDEPYVLASQAEQVYYVNDIQDPKWYVVVKTKPRDYLTLLPLMKKMPVLNQVNPVPKLAKKMK